MGINLDLLPPWLGPTYQFSIQISKSFPHVRMAERSKAPDSRNEILPRSNVGAFWSTIVGVGSNPTSDRIFS